MCVRHESGALRRYDRAFLRLFARAVVVTCTACQQESIDGARLCHACATAGILALHRTWRNACPLPMATQAIDDAIAIRGSKLAVVDALRVVRSVKRVHRSRVAMATSAQLLLWGDDVPTAPPTATATAPPTATATAPRLRTPKPAAPVPVSVQMDAWARAHPSATAGEAAAQFGLSGPMEWFRLRGYA